MAQRLAYLEAVVGADVTQFRKGMRDVRNEVGFLSETVQGLSGLGRSLTFTFTTPVLALGTAAINVASEFQASMYNINAIAGLTGSELDALGQRALEFGARTRGGANAAADALYTVFSAGLTNTEDAFRAMEVATYTAEAGLADMTTTTETLIAVMLSYGDTSEAMAWQTSDAITQMVAVGVGSMQEFSTALSSVIPTAAAAGMGFDELAADMAFLTQRGLSASRAGVSLNAAIEQMVNPTEAMSSAFGELGARGLPDLIDQFGSVNGAIEALIGTADGDLTTLYEMFNSRQARRAVGLFATDLEGWNAAIEDFYGSVDGATMRAWEEQMSSFSASWDLLTSAVEGAGIAIGQTLFPVLQPMIDGITDLILGITAVSPELLGMGAAFTVVAAAIPPLLWLLGSLISPFGLIVGAISAVVVAFANDFMGITTSIQNAVSGALTHIQPLIDIFNEIRDVIDSYTNASDLQETFFPTDNVVMPDPYDYITVTEPTSLWEIYESEGYSEHFSWDEFMDNAIANGWEGGAITPASDLRIDLTGTELEPVGVPSVSDDFLEVIDTEPRTVWEIAFEVVGNYMPTIQAELTRIWGVVRDWIDQRGAEFINGIRGWFTEGAGTNLYTAFTALLTGDFEGAINAVIPNMGTTVANAIGNWDLSQAFPRISASLNALFINVGDWLLSTGVPLLAQSAGFLAGRIGTLLYNAVQAAIGFFTSADTEAIGNYVDEGVVDPFVQGFNEATEGTEFGGLLADFELMMQELSDTLTEAADILDLDVTWDTLEEIGDSIGYFWNTISEADYTGISLVAFGIVAAFINLTNSIGNSFSSLLRGFADAVVYLMDGVTAATEGDWLGALQGLGGAFINLAFALLQIPAGIFDWFLNGLDQLMGYDMGNVSDWLEEMRLMLTGGGAGLTETDLDVPITLTPQFEFTGTMINGGLIAREATEIIQDELIGVSLSLNDIQLTYNGNAVSGLEMPDEIDFSQDTLTLVADIQNLQMSTNADERALGDMLYFALLEGMDAQDAGTFSQLVMGFDDIVIAPNGVVYELTDSGYVIVQDSTLTTDEDVTVETTGTTTIANTGETEMATDENGVPTVTIPQVNLSPVATAFSDDLLAGEDAQGIIDTQLVPLEDAWNAMFAADGEMAISFSTFSDDIATGWGAIDMSMQDTITTMNEDFPAAITGFDAHKSTLVTAMETIESAANEAKNEVQGLKGAIEGLLDLEGSISVDVTVSGSGADTDGTHKTGLGTVPYDGYVAELHKGEAVLTAKEAEAYRNSSIPSEITLSDSGRGNGGTTVNNVNIQGNQSVDDMLREFKRRGIKLK